MIDAGNGGRAEIGGRQTAGWPVRIMGWGGPGPAPKCRPAWHPELQDTLYRQPGMVLPGGWGRGHRPGRATAPPVEAGGKGRAVPGAGRAPVVPGPPGGRAGPQDHATATTATNSNPTTATAMGKG